MFDPLHAIVFENRMKTVHAMSHVVPFGKTLELTSPRTCIDYSDW